MTNQLITHWLPIDYLLMSLIINEICLVIYRIWKKNATLAAIKRPSNIPTVLTDSHLHVSLLCLLELLLKLTEFFNYFLGNYEKKNFKNGVSFVLKKKVLMRKVFLSLLKWSQAAILCGPFSGPWIKPAISCIACSRLRDSWARWIERARRWK